MFLDIEDEDPETVERECLEIFNSYSENPPAKTVSDITLPGMEYESAVQAKKRTAHCSSTMANYSALGNKTVSKAKTFKSAQEVMYERYRTAEKAKETQVQHSSPLPSPSHMSHIGGGPNSK